MNRISPARGGQADDNGEGPDKNAVFNRLYARAKPAGAPARSQSKDRNASNEAR